ncbi:hypothetical protein KJ980_01275 [Patescibacteria group bacterium]|nr:hypothetical protein [Patescibacteria group bacterium]MBU4015926.1 hypothetical protein [Patescibacteria group bacterium]MBU4098259.1 hypothetical protein [Patescibacteria group bacterium]
MKTKKKLLHKKNSIYKGGAGNGMVFVVIIMLMMVAIAFALIGGQLPQLDNSKVGNPVVLVTSAPQNAKRNLQLYTFIGMTITPSPTPIPAANPTPTPQATPALTPSPNCSPTGAAGKGPSSIIINPDKTISINGKKTFPQIFYSICDGTHIFGDQCVTSLQRMSIFDADLVGYAKVTNPEHEQEGMGYINMVNSGTGNKDKPNFFGYVQVDEPIATGQNVAALEQAYRNIKAADPNHVVIAVDWTRLNELRNMADIIADDGYTYIDKQWLYDIGYTRQTALYFKESLVYNPGNPGSALNGVNDFDGISKPVYAVIQALSTDDNANVQPVTKSELRGLIFLAITMNMKGLFYYTYNEQTDDLSVHYGLVRDQTLVQQYIDQAAEIKALNDILVLPTKDYRWQHRQGTQVSFSKALTASGSIYIDGYTNFNYMLKQDGSVYYLIVLNKDTRSISDVVITVSGLNGPMTAKKIIGSSTTANQDTPVNNGVFTDSFDGLAVHVYQIYSGPTPPPLPSCN